MTATEDLLSSALRTGAVRFAATPDLPGTLSRSRRIRLRRLGASSLATVAVLALAVSAVLSTGSDPSPAGSKSHNFSPIARSPLALRVAASEVSLGSDVFVWGGERAAPKRGVLADGAIYSADSNRWRKVAHSPLSARLQAPAVRTPRGVLVVGGSRVDDLLHADLRSGALYDPATNRWTTIPDAPFCPHLAVPQGSIVYAYGTTCDASDKAAFGWYDLTQNRWHLAPLPASGTQALFPYQGFVVALARNGETQLLGPQRDYWVLLDPLPVDNGSGALPRTDVIADVVTAWEGTTLYAVGQWEGRRAGAPVGDFGRKGTAVYAMSGLGWVETGKLPFDINPSVQPPARFAVQASVQRGVLVWHSERGVSWFNPATFAGGFVATSGARPAAAITSTPLIPAGGGRFLWWGGHTGESIPSTHQALSKGALLSLP